MRWLLIPALALLLGLSPAPAVDPPKDTQTANFTRTKKLKGKVTVDFKNEFLKEALKEISGQLADAKLGELSVTFAVGVSANTRVTYAGKDVTAEEALDGILKQLDLGYVIVSKDKDRYDGWLLIGKGNERGYPAGVGPKVEPKKGDGKKEEMKKDEPKKEEAKKEDPKKEDTKKTEEKLTEDDEKAAASKFELAKKLDGEGKPDKAKIQLKFLLKHYPGSKVEAEAKELLEKLDK